MHLFLALFGMWIVCSGHYEPFFLLGGLLSCILVFFLARRMGLAQHRSPPLYFRPQFWRYSAWLMLEIIISGVEVSIIVLRRKLRIRPMLGWIEASQKTERGLVTYANSITLTPGTVSVGVEKGRLRVHALDKSMFHTLMEEIMDRRVTKEVE